MIRIFISYMRKDQLFVRRLHETLVAQGHDVWADFEDIPLSSKWLAEIYDGIEKADVILSVLSPEYLISENCNKEVEHSVKHNKRIIPIVRRDVDFRQVPKALAEINAIFFRESEDFDAKFKDLSDTINLDLAWTKAHTRLLTRAIEWDSKKRDESLVLRGADLRTAEEWSAQAATGKEPKPTPLQSEYILASRKSATRQQRMILTGVTIALVVAIGLACLASILGLFAWDQSNVATNQKNTAVAERNVRATAEAQAIAERNVAQSRELATNAILLSTNDPELSIRLALEAYTLVPSPQVEEALRIALANPARLVLRGHMLGVSSATFSPDGKRIITGSIDETARIWDARTGKTLMELKGHTDPVMSTEFSPDGQYVVTADWGGKTRVWNATTGQVVREFTGTIASFSPDSKSIVTASVNSVSIWQVIDHQQSWWLENVNRSKRFL